MPLRDAPVIVFVATTDPAAARSFYGDTLRLTPHHEEEGMALVFALGGGATSRVTVLDEYSPPPFTILGWVVGDIAKTVDELTARGVRFERYDTLEHDERGIHVFPGGDRVAWFHDPEGSTLSVTQPG